MLETPNLLIRPHKIEDAPHLFELNSDPDVMRYTGDSSFENSFEALKLIEERMIPVFEKYRMGRFAVHLKDGTYIGWCGLKPFPEKNEVDLGYRFKKNYWGKGYATEASLVCLEYGFNTLKLEKIIAKAMPENIGSIKVLQKLKMKYRGFVRDDSDPHSFNLYTLTKQEFNQ